MIMKICPECTCRIGPDDLPCPNGCKNVDSKQEMRGVLENIINSCVHPEIAVRAVFVDLKPIREVLKKVSK